MSGASCNINPKGEQKRRRVGIAGIVLGVAGGCTIAWLDVATGLRWLLFLPFAVGFTSMFEAQEKTCVAYAAAGVRDGETEREVVTSAEERRESRAHALRIVVRSTLAAGLATLVFVLI